MFWKILRWSPLLLPVGLALLYLSTFNVDASEYVYLTQFGRKVAVYDGGDPDDAGLHFKLPWPIQSVQRIDRRLQVFDLPGAELLTRDPGGKTIDKTLTIDAYVTWRIAGRDGAERFVRAVGSPQAAQLILGQRVSSELGAAVAQMEPDDLISIDPSKVEEGREWLRRRLLEGGVRDQTAHAAAGAAAAAGVDVGEGRGRSLRETARREYGIEVVDVRVRRLNHPEAVRAAIFDRIRSERAMKVAQYQSEGERVASEIRSRTERELAEMKAEAEAKAIELRGQADADADRTRYEAQRLDPKLYALLRKLESYQRIVGDGKTTVYFSTRRNQFDLLNEPPQDDHPKMDAPVRKDRKD
jgi:membrane protease subunit HflC